MVNYLFQMFFGNKDTSNVAINILDPPIPHLVALRILPKTMKPDGSRGDLCLQIEVLGCSSNNFQTVKSSPSKLIYQLGRSN